MGSSSSNDGSNAFGRSTVSPKQRLSAAMEDFRRRVEIRPVPLRGIVGMTAWLLIAAVVLMSGIPLHAQLSDSGTLKLSDSERRQRTARLGESDRAFLDLAAPILPEAEVDAFLLLDTDQERESAIDSFWTRRAAGGDAREWRRDYAARHEETGQLFESRTSDRAQIYLLRGRPSSMMPVPCGDYFHPIEVWSYESLPGLEGPVHLLFYKPENEKQFRLATTSEDDERPLDEKLLSKKGRRIGPVPIILGIPETASSEPVPLALECPAGREVLQAIALAKQSPRRISDLLDRSVHHRRETKREERLVLSSPGNDTIPLNAAVAYPGKRGGRTVASIRLNVDPAQLTVRKESGREFYAIRLRGEVRDKSSVIDRFRYDYEIPADRDPLQVVLERFLPPYDYELTLHVKDGGSEAEGLLSMPIEVPYVRPQNRGEMGEERRAVVAEMEQEFRPGEPSVRLIPLGSGFYTGRQRFETILTGNVIDAVEFWVGDQKIMAKRQPPYTLELDLGDIPRTRTIRVVGRDQRGRVVAGDELVVNGGSNPFRVRIISPRVSQGLQGETRVEVVASVPDEYELESIELYLDDERIAIGYESPLIQTIRIPSSDTTAYLRAVATINDELRSSTEDVVLLNAPELLEEIDVRLVELPTTVLRRREVVDDLTAEDFEVYDEGERVEIDKFDYVRDLPLSIGMAVDSSGSMRPRMAEALKTGARFFQNVMRPGDRAFLLAFSDEPKLVQGWTDSLASLTAGLASLDAAEMTALHDAVVHSLYNFEGLRGQKALVVISDGQDTASGFSFDQALEYSRRIAIPIYTIGLGIRRVDVETRAKLVKLAEETGGESYFIEIAAGLGDTFEQIELELRSQYILGFYPPEEATESGAYRRVEVKVDGAKAKTVRGYYP